MTVLVTGGAGYIGSHMVLELGDAGERAVVLDILSTGFSWAIAGGVPLISGDCGDQAVVARLIRDYGIEAIIHFAASVGSLLTSILGWIPRQPTSWNCVGGKRPTAKK